MTDLPASKSSPSANYWRERDIDYPAGRQTKVTFKKAPKARLKAKGAKEGDLFDDAEKER